MSTTVANNPPPPRLQPVLASTLLTFESTSNTHDASTQEGYRTGVKVLDHDLPSDVFGGGKVMGICGVGSMHAHSQYLIHSLITTQLTTTTISTSTSSPSSSSSNRQTSVYLIEPRGLPGIDSPLLRIYNLLESRIQNTLQKPNQSILPNHRPQQNTKINTNIDIDIDELIDTVSVIPYFDLLGISQALSEIAENLRVQTPPHQSHPDASANANIQSNSNKSSKEKGTIILLHGLGDTLASQISRPGTHTHTGVFSLLTDVLRQLKRISRSHGKRVLVLIEGCAVVEQRRLGHDADLGRDSIGMTGEGPNDTTTTIHPNTPTINSAFSSADGSVMRLVLDTSTATTKTTTTAPTQHRPKSTATEEHRLRAHDILARMLEDGLDGLVVLHDGFGTAGRNEDRDADANMEKCIVEIVRDRVGGSFGAWAVWDVNVDVDVDVNGKNDLGWR